MSASLSLFGRLWCWSGDLPVYLTSYLLSSNLSRTLSLVFSTLVLIAISSHVSFCFDLDLNLAWLPPRLAAAVA